MDVDMLELIIEKMKIYTDYILKCFTSHHLITIINIFKLEKKRLPYYAA